MKPSQPVFEIVPAGAAPEDEARLRLTRRRLMSLMAASAALAGAGCSRPPPTEVHPFVDTPEAGFQGEALYYASSFVRDGFAHGVLVGTREGRPIKIEGNAWHPASLGRTDVFAQASVLGLWDPDRSDTVRQRRAPDRPATPSTWAAFDAAWLERAAELQRRDGQGLRLLLPCVTSPTLRAQLAMLQQRFPRAVLHRHDALPALPAELQASRAAWGRPLRCWQALDQAQVVLALACDPFSDGPQAVRRAADWSRARAAQGPAGAARLFAVEGTPGLFGARADARLALAPKQAERLVERLAASLGVIPAPPDASAAPADVAAFEARLLDALRHAGPRALIVAGDTLSTRTQALVFAIHQRLGCFERTVHVIEPPDAHELADLPSLLAAIDQGEVDTLLVLGSNPAYASPGAWQVGAAIERVPFSIHAGLYADETARRCRWHLPLSHDYEQWSDARAFDGSASLLQPAIQPLYDTRSAHELLAALLGDPLRRGRELVRRHWQGVVGTDGFDDFWVRSLRRGVIDGSAFADVLPGPVRLPPAPPAAEAEPGLLTAVFRPHPSVHDGAFANNAWLQELPHPFTRITWRNALHLGPRTAQALSLQSGDVVSACVGARCVEAPVWVQPTHAEGLATLPLGFGRSAAGRVGTGQGFDAYALLPADAAPVPIRLTPTGRRLRFARTQNHMQQEDRELARSVPAADPRIDAEAERPSLYPPVPKAAEHAWGMAIDLDACIGCNACTIACQAENNIPVVGADEVAAGREMHWIRVDHYHDPAHAGEGSTFQPVPCMHCENAPCEIVCPVGATVHDSEGLNVQVYNRCVGTRFCSNNCPYKVRRFNFLQYSERDTPTLTALHNPEVTVRARGVMEKCTYCLQRITRARIEAETHGRPIADGDVVTACQATCPTGAIHFGDVSDPSSAVSRIKRSPRHYTMLGELNTRPRTTYLARIAPRTGEAE